MPQLTSSHSLWRIFGQADVVNHPSVMDNEVGVGRGAGSGVSANTLEGACSVAMGRHRELNS